jgi:hypothetical protein
MREYANKPAMVNIINSSFFLPDEPYSFCKLGLNNVRKWKAATTNEYPIISIIPLIQVYTKDELSNEIGCRSAP